MWYLEKHNKVAPIQSGYRKNRSTNNRLVQMSNGINDSLKNRECTIAIFFYLQKAYDTAWRHNILMTLHEYNLRGPLQMYIGNFLNNRTIIVRFGNVHSNPYRTTEGMPQGSVLSCTLFTVAINTIRENLPNSIKTLYVDDFAIYASGKHQNSIERRLQLAIDHLTIWSNQTGFVFS